MTKYTPEEIKIIHETAAAVDTQMINEIKSSPTIEEAHIRHAYARHRFDALVTTRLARHGIDANDPIGYNEI